MLKFPLLIALMLLPNGCEMRRPPKPEPLLKTSDICPIWKDASKGRKLLLADEIDEAQGPKVWKDVLVADQALKDQLVAAGCKPI